MFSEWANKTWLRLKGLFKRRQLDRDLEDELAFHLAKREQRNLEAGMEANEARYAARRQFGNVSWTKQRSHEMWTFVSLCGCFAKALRSPRLPSSLWLWASARIARCSALSTQCC